MFPYLRDKVDNEHGLPGLSQPDGGRVPAALPALRGKGGEGGGAHKELQQLHHILHEGRHMLQLLHPAHLTVATTRICKTHKFCLPPVSKGKWVPYQLNTNQELNHHKPTVVYKLIVKPVLRSRSVNNRLYCLEL